MANSSDEDEKERKRLKKEKKKLKKEKKEQKKLKKEEKKRRKEEKKKKRNHSEGSTSSNEKPTKRSKPERLDIENGPGSASNPVKEDEITPTISNKSNTKKSDHGDPRIVESSALDFGPGEENGITLLLFYQYVEPIWSLEKYQQVLKDMDALGRSLDLTGRMRVAREGLNCTLTSTSRDTMIKFCQTMRKQPEFQNTEFKITNDLPIAQRFPQFKVIEVIELVHYGLEGEKAPPIQDYHGVHLEPEEYHKKIAEKDTVMIDVRNHYEAIIGHFQPPKKEQMLDPLMRKSTEFPVWLDKKETKEKLKGKQVLMYCTGGIRCER